MPSVSSFALALLTRDNPLASACHASALPSGCGRAASYVCKSSLLTRAPPRPFARAAPTRPCERVPRGRVKAEDGKSPRAWARRPSVRRGRRPRPTLRWRKGVALHRSLQRRLGADSGRAVDRGELTVRSRKCAHTTERKRSAAVEMSHDDHLRSMKRHARIGNRAADWINKIKSHPVADRSSSINQYLI